MEILEESIFPEKQVVYASFAERLLAMVIDRVILAPIYWIFLILVLFLSNRFDADIYTDYLALVSFFIIDWLYYALLESAPRKATLGKIICGICVTTTGSGRISFLQATSRYFGKYLSRISLGIGYMMMLSTDKSQTLHDKIAKTLVVTRSH